MRRPSIRWREALAKYRVVRRACVTTTVFVVVWLGISSLIAYKLTHRLSVRADEVAPTLAWGRIESHWLKTADGEDVGAWYVEGRPDAPGVLVVHGHKGKRVNSLSRAELFASWGYAVLMITVRAHGDSSGDFDDIGYGARNDVIAGVSFLESRRPGRPVIVDGTSMGAAAAIFAGRDLGRRVRGYLLESLYRDLRTAVWNRVEAALPPLLDLAAYAGLNLVAPLFLPHLDEIAPIKAITGIPEDVHVLILSGTGDELARVHEARALHEKVAAHGRLVLFPGSGHGDLFRSRPELYRRTVREFCGEVVGAVRNRLGSL
ncbi:MAG: alpha/beta hydrolase [Isosphaeraceae bacterium]